MMSGSKCDTPHARGGEGRKGVSGVAVEVAEARLVFVDTGRRLRFKACHWRWMLCSQSSDMTTHTEVLFVRMW